MSKEISETEQNRIIAELENKYGEFGEDFGASIVTVKGQEKFYAVKCPTSAQWFDFQNKANLYFTKLNAQASNVKAVPTKGLQDTMINLIADCLITDVVGVASNADFVEDYQIRPKLVDSLFSVITELAESGVRTLKKE